MTRPENNDMHRDPLRDLISDSVADVEPSDALDSIRDRTRVTPIRSRRPWLLGAGGAVVATAATITAIALAGNLGDDDADPGPASTPSGYVSDDAPTSDQSGAQDVAVPVYYVGDGPDHARLFREFHSMQIGSAGHKLAAAVSEAVSGEPFDPDYRSPWPEGTTLDQVTYDGDLITIDLASGGSDLRQRPAGLSADDAAMAIEQVIYTAQGAVSDGRKPVQFLIDGKHSDMVLGVPTAEPLANAPVSDTLSQMSITAPREGVEVSGSMTATGVNNGFEANVQWELLDADGTVVKKDFGTADGWMGNRLFPWRVEVDLAGVAPGTYTFRAHNEDPSAGAEGSGPAEDTRTIIVK